MLPLCPKKSSVVGTLYMQYDEKRIYSLFGESTYDLLEGRSYNIRWRQGKMQMETPDGVIATGVRWLTFHTKKEDITFDFNPHGVTTYYVGGVDPMLHQGSLFVSFDNKMVQEVVSVKYATAFVVNTPAYRPVAGGFSTAVMDARLSDEEVVDNAIVLLKNQNIRFMRIHLQSPATVLSSGPDFGMVQGGIGKTTDRSQPIANNRRMGYEDALRHHNIRVDKSLIQVCDTIELAH